MVHARHKKSPLQVGDMGLFDDLANMSLARLLINNTACVRVS
jgi:hypothetical protein